MQRRGGRIGWAAALGAALAARWGWWRVRAATTDLTGQVGPPPASPNGRERARSLKLRPWAR